jgi:hypothetical protein
MQAELVLAGLALAALARVCGAQTAAALEQKFPDVIAVKVQASGSDAFDFDVTISSPYDTPRRYADGFRVTAKSGAVYGERKLLHDHADEQPFTRELVGVKVPRGLRSVVVQARDQVHGYGGAAMEVMLPRRD